MNFPTAPALDDLPPSFTKVPDFHGGTHYSFHAIERLGQRFRIGIEELRDQLAVGLFVHLGNDSRDARTEYLLFYSVDDGGWGVVVRDAMTLTILTLLPLVYYSSSHRKVTPDEKRAAKALVRWGVDPVSVFGNDLEIAA